MPLFPSCQNVDLSEYFDFNIYTPLRISIYVAKKENMGVSFYFGDRNKALRRKQRFSILSYSGPAFRNMDLDNPIIMQGVFKLSQTINSDRDPSNKCTNYPNAAHNSYKECDGNYLQQFFSVYQLMPPWVTRNMKEVTILRFYNSSPGYYFLLQPATRFPDHLDSHGLFCHSHRLFCHKYNIRILCLNIF